MGYSVQQTADGGYIIAGVTESFGAGLGDVYLIKTDPNGNSQWQRTFGGSSWDESLAVQRTLDDGFIIAGRTDSFGAGYPGDVYLIKTDSQGNLLWEKTFGATGWDKGCSVKQTFDGGFIIAGGTNSFGAGKTDVYLIKTDPNGNSEWEKTFGGNDYDWGRSVHQTADGGYIIAGHLSHSAEKLEVYLVKTDPNGNSEWEKTFGGNDDDVAHSFQQTIDGGFIIAGWTESFGAGREDVYLIKTDSVGNLQWEKTLGGIYRDEAWSVQQTINAGYIIVGWTMSFDAGNRDVYLIKLCSDGTLAGDLNCDGIIVYDDLEILFDQWLQPRSISYPPADIYGLGDGIVNFFDFTIIAEQWMEEE